MVPLPFSATKVPVLLLLLLLPSSKQYCEADVTRGTVILKRGADANWITSTLLGIDADEQNKEHQTCAFDGLVSFSHPMSLMPGDKFFSTGQLQLKSIEMMVDQINTKRCGVLVDGKRYGIELTTYGDDSSKDKVGAIVENAMTADANSGRAAAYFWLGPYSSGLTGAMSSHANKTNTVLVAGGAASTSVFEGNPTVFGTFPPTSRYLAQAIEALAGAGAQTISSVWEDASFTRGVCAALPSLAEVHGMTVMSRTEVPASPTANDLDPVARNLSLAELTPDVVVTCVYNEGCAEWIASLRRANWTPKAQVFTVCVGMDSFLDAIGPADAVALTGISPWDPSLPMEDDVVGWSASEFADRFLTYTARTPTYHAASAAASVGALVQAIERAGSFEVEKIASILSSEEFTTLYGQLSFDDNGQSQAPSLFLQYDANAAVQTVYPLESRSGGDLVYPMPTWAHRDCTFQSTCETGSESTVAGTCREDGSCECVVGAISRGIGPSASCSIVPVEDQTYISSWLVVVGLILFVVQCIMSVSCTAWTIYYRSSRIVMASQPVFLCLMCFGVFVLNLAILPIGIQGRYRYEQDPFTGEVLMEVPNSDIGRVDAACMALPWLFSMGFSIIFSALFAKIWRIRKVWKAAQAFVGRKVNAKNVALIVVAVVVIQAIILLCWQLIDPLRWKREVIFSDTNGYPTKSVGYCQSGTTMRFLIPLLVIDGIMLLYALYLCFVTRKVSSDYHEGTWITASVLSIIQILIISIPVLIITDKNNDAFYFVRAAVIFLMSSTVTMLIFFPKMYRLHMKSRPDHQRNSIASQRSTTHSGNDVTDVQSIRNRVSQRASVHQPGQRPPMSLRYGLGYGSRRFEVINRIRRDGRGGSNNRSSPPSTTVTFSVASVNDPSLGNNHAPAMTTTTTENPSGSVRGVAAANETAIACWGSGSSQQAASDSTAASDGIVPRLVGPTASNAATAIDHTASAASLALSGPAPPSGH